MSRSIFKALRFIVFLAIGLILLYFAFRDVSFEELLASLQKADLKWVTFTLAFGLVGYISRAYRWKLLIKPLNYDPPLKNVFYALMIGYTANFAFPRIGEISRCGSLQRSDKIPLDSLLGTVIIERAIDLVMLLFILIVVFFSKIGFFGAFLKNNIFEPLLNRVLQFFQLSVMNWVIFIASVIVLIFLIRFLNRKFSENPVVKKIKELVRGVFVGLKTIVRMRDRWSFIFHTLLIWMMYFLMTYVLLFSFPATSQLGPLDGLFLLVIGGLGMSAPVQGGIGAFHWIISAGLSLYGVSRVDAVAYATLSHESQAFFAIFLGALSFMMLMIQKRRALKIHKK
ncbi:MAG: lysylphosphatidylglycerol synthase transmembrane domain-containing protein [Bacteroidales bacterium]|nr:flippase-like domain-containing protein [Bacteroidales bacterium]MBS3774566.1 flippase-like domain-containing protein [Bacteroidales bacterium]